jgi:iduronate 2-sulfatase
MSKYSQKPAASWQACCASCKADASCAAWTWHADQAAKDGCYLSSDVTDRRDVAGATCGFARGPTPAPTPTPPFPDYCATHTCRNVLYLTADDMRADWHAYGIADPVTPHLDALAAGGLLFTHAYCHISVCAPSRMSFMTSRRPDSSGVWNFIDTVTLDTQATPGHFKDHGYLTLGLGKMFHQAAGAWNKEKYWDLGAFDYYDYGVGKCPHGGQGGGHCVQDDDEIYDWHLRQQTIVELTYAINQSKATKRPFFVAAGFRKPHAPWQAPQRMYDLYNQSALAVPAHKTLPAGAPLIAWSHQLGVQLENGTGFSYGPEQPVPDWVMRDQRHAYYAAVSYTDEHIGAILAVLEQSGVADDTLVVFHADHGYARSLTTSTCSSSTYLLTPPLLVSAHSTPLLVATHQVPPGRARRVGEEEQLRPRGARAAGGQGAVAQGLERRQAH